MGDLGQGMLTAQVQLVAFSLAGADFAMDIMRLKEVIQGVPVTPVPRAPQFLEGVIDLRGAALAWAACMLACAAADAHLAQRLRAASLF